jgi:hypothetical protein
VACTPADSVEGVAPLPLFVEAIMSGIGFAVALFSTPDRLAAAAQQRLGR